MSFLRPLRTLILLYDRTSSCHDRIHGIGPCACFGGGRGGLISWFVDLAAVRSGLACCISSVAVWVAASWSRVQLAENFSTSYSTWAWLELDLGWSCVVRRFVALLVGAVLVLLLQMVSSTGSTTSTCSCCSSWAAAVPSAWAPSAWLAAQAG